jgi:hypothetical protein
MTAGARIKFVLRNEEINKIIKIVFFFFFWLLKVIMGLMKRR